MHAAVGYLRYTRDYYPSGTKQTSGSRLDRIVERSRRLAELRIIQMLQEATGKDLGSDADVWIREFTDEPVAQQATAAEPSHRLLVLKLGLRLD